VKYATINQVASVASPSGHSFQQCLQPPLLRLAALKVKKNRINALNAGKCHSRQVPSSNP
jgi:hypothetical protein